MISSIAKADATVVVTGYSVTYDGQPHTASYTSHGGEQRNGRDGGHGERECTTHTNAGTYTSEAWSFTGTANYNDTQRDGEQQHREGGCDGGGDRLQRDI